jgi:hypothetical protein
MCSGVMFVLEVRGGLRSDILYVAFSKERERCHSYVRGCIKTVIGDNDDIFAPSIGNTKKLNKWSSQMGCRPTENGCLPTVIIT